MSLSSVARTARISRRINPEKLSVPSHWDTTDEDEVNRRRHRAQTEAMQVNGLKSVHGYFGDFTVKSESGREYAVEIRSLVERINSCDCADYDTNGLGTCKHIEKTLLMLKARGVRKFTEAARQGSARVEIHVHSEDGTVRIAYPQETDPAARQFLDAFFLSDGRLMAEPEIGIPVIRRAVEQAAPEVAACIRLSRRLKHAELRGRGFSHRQEAREHFLQDVRDGKRSLDIVKLPLYEYQRHGMLHLAFAERAILADEMGLGKTVQAIAASELLRRLHGVRHVLVVATTSLKSEWEEQIGKFCDLSSVLISGSRPERLRQYQSGAFFFLTNYEQVLRDHDDIQRLLAPDIIILDEAQRIKNWRTKTAVTIKTLQSRYAFVLTGTPIENRIDDLYSIVQFLDPKFFGPLFRFNREYYKLDDKGKPAGYKNLDALHRRVRPILLRRRKSDVEGELPERTVNNYFVPMTEEQALRYADYESIVAKLAAAAQRRPLLPKEFEKLQLSLACMRMLCDTPYILDDQCRLCPKLDELESLFDELLEDDTTKIIIFSEWERMLTLVREALEARGVVFSWHTGSVEQKKRATVIQNFKNDPACRVFLSTDAGSVGLNLQAANVVINLDLPWNPAKLEQRIARAWRKHQTRSVQVINLVSENTIEHRMLGLLKQKQALADNVLEENGAAEMDMPSGRAAMMERLNEVLGQPSAPHKTPAPAQEEQPVDPLERFREETLARLAPRTERLEAHGNTILAIVEGDTKEPEARMREMLSGVDPQQSLSLEVLDRATYAAIERLIATGVLSWNGAATPLYRTHISADSEREVRQRRMREARGILEQAERKRRVVELLLTNGFDQEARAPLEQAYETALKALAAFTGEAQPLAIPDTIREIPELAVSVTALFERIEEQFNRAMLECAA